MYQEPNATIEHTKIKCINCAGNLKYDPSKTSLVCEYCGTINEMPSLPQDFEIQEIDLESFLQEQKTNIAVQQTIITVSCTNCAAATTLPPNVSSSNCPFCDTPLIVQNATTHQVIKPKYLLAFQNTQKNAHQLFKDWAGTLWFAPNDLTQKLKDAEKMRGVYIPYWTYDAQTDTAYTGQRGDDYFETEYIRDENGNSQAVTVTKTRWRSVSGRVDKFFDDVLVHASNSLPQEYVAELEPWDLEELKPFDEMYLAGFITETYQIDIKKGLDVAKDIMEGGIRYAINRDIGGDHQTILSMRTNYYDTTFKHILLPIWISAYRYKDKVYRFMVNGRTGEVQGERPYSVWKIVFLSIAVIAVIAALLYLYSENNDGGHVRYRRR